MFHSFAPAVSLLFAVQVLGVLSSISVRRCAGTGREPLVQFSFFVWLTLVGLSTIASALFAPGYCLVCGTTLAIMVLTAIWDTRPAEPAAPFGR
ncbi:MAG: hypothetical protein K2Y37_24870 [Pirellulales bacterium]|nr:hypothetical protein [Pirellulales bacterium]